MNNVATKMQDAVARYVTPNWNVDVAIWSAEHEPRPKDGSNQIRLYSRAALARRPHDTPSCD